MFTSKSSVYKVEWLDLVFENRNKSYGAYELRLHNSETTTKALFSGAFLAVALIVGPFLYTRLTNNETVENSTRIEEPVLKLTEVVLKEIELPKPEAAGEQERVAPPTTRTERFVEMTVVSAQQVIEEPPANSVLQDAIVSNVTTGGEIASLGAVVESGSGGDGVSGNENGAGTNEVYQAGTLSKYPEFPGGQEAFVKFLRKNLRYPSLAVENHTTGRVFLSFIIEKNGALTDIKILRGIGDGCDEEAMRVLKKAPAWSPGEQNGQKVRVFYTIPIYFHLD